MRVEQSLVLILGCILDSCVPWLSSCLIAVLEFQRSYRPHSIIKTPWECSFAVEIGILEPCSPSKVPSIALSLISNVPLSSQLPNPSFSRPTPQRTTFFQMIDSFSAIALSQLFRYQACHHAPYPLLAKNGILSGLEAFLVVVIHAIECRRNLGFCSKE